MAAQCVRAQESKQEVVGCEDEAHAEVHSVVHCRFHVLPVIGHRIPYSSEGVHDPFLHRLSSGCLIRVQGAVGHTLRIALVHPQIVLLLP